MWQMHFVPDVLDISGNEADTALNVWSECICTVEKNWQNFWQRREMKENFAFRAMTWCHL